MAEPKSAEPTTRTTPPYMSPRTLRNFLDSLGVNGVPGRIDRSVLKTFSGGAQSALIAALRFLELTGPDDAPTPDLHRLVDAEVDARKAIMRDLLERHYPFMFPPKFDLSTATLRMVREAFDDAFSGGDTARKAMVFFLGTARDAGIVLSRFIKVREVNRPPGTGRRRGTNGKGVDTQPDAPVVTSTTPQKTVFETLIGILDPKLMNEKEQAAVWTLIKYLKKQGKA